MNRGRGYEACIEAVLKEKCDDVKFQQKTTWVGLFNNKITLDFLCKQEEYTFCIEVKWQDVQGTASQKIVYAIEQIKQCHQYPTYLVLGGNGWSKGSIDWAMSQSPNKMFLGCLTTDMLFSKLIKGEISG